MLIVMVFMFIFVIVSGFGMREFVIFYLFVGFVSFEELVLVVLLFTFVEFIMFVFVGCIVLFCFLDVFFWDLVDEKFFGSEN